MRSYGITKGRFWNGPTGRELRAVGADAQLVALYLFTGPHANAIGLYYLPFELLLKHVALPGNRIRKSLLDLDRLHFAHYDDSTEVVWVSEMAHHQLGVLRPGDGRVKAASRIYAELPPNPYLGSFFDRYAVDLQLVGPRRVNEPLEGVPLGVPLGDPYTVPDPDPDPVLNDSRTSSARTSSYARATDDAPPLDEWFRQLAAEYPRQRVTTGYLTESAFADAIARDPRPAREAFDDMLAHLENHKRGYDWRVKRMIPRLERWLREGLWHQLHDEHPPESLVSDKTLATMAAGDAFVKGGNRGAH